MRIVYLHQYYTTPTEGGATRSYEFARRWAAAGHDVHVICGSTPAIPPVNETEETGVHVHRLPTEYHANMPTAKRLQAFMNFALRSSTRARQLEPDAVYATSTPLTVAIPARAATVWRPAGYVFEVRDLWPDIPIAMGYLGNPALRWASRRLEESAYFRASHVVTLAPGMRDDICARGIPTHKVTVIPQGCDVDLFDELAGPNTETEPGWMQGRRVVLYAGALGRANGVDLVVELAKEARLRAPELAFVVIGDGPEADSIRDAADAYGVLGVNYLQLSALPKTDISAWFRRASATLALFRGPRVLWKDAVQNKFFDSVSTGRPVFSNFNGWQTQIAEANGIGGQLDADPIGAVEQLAVAVSDQEWLMKVERSCRHLAAFEFNRDKQARAALDILEALA